MRARAVYRCAPIVLCWFASCSGGKPEAPPREEVEALLRQEAEIMKREAEADVNPALGVEVNWTIQGVEVRERPNDETRPWAGTIRYIVESRTPELDGTVTERFERSNDYVWDSELDAWVIQ